jgi:ribosomal protein L7/L12
MPIVVRKPRNIPEGHVEMESHDADLIKRIRDQIGKIEAIRVTRWLTKAGLIESKNFVEQL